MASMIKDYDTNTLVPSCSIQVRQVDRARLNKIRGEHDLRTYSDVVCFLLNKLDREREEKQKVN